MNKWSKVTGVAWADRQLLKKLEREWEAANDERRAEIEQEKAKILARYTEASEEAKEDSENQSSKKSDNVPKKPTNQREGNKKSKIPALSDLPHGLYCGYVELMPMVHGSDDRWMAYETFREKNPDANIFDVPPTNIAIMYMNQARYQELNSADPHEIMNHCVRRLPTEYEVIEIDMINGLLCAEAQHDPRIKKLGYKGENMYDFEKNGLYRDFYDGVIFNVLHVDMSLEQARKFARDGKIDDNAGTGDKKDEETPKITIKEKEETPKIVIKEQHPPKKPTPKPTPNNRSHARATL